MLLTYRSVLYPHFNEATFRSVHIPAWKGSSMSPGRNAIHVLDGPSSSFSRRKEGCLGSATSQSTLSHGNIFHSFAAQSRRHVCKAQDHLCQSTLSPSANHLHPSLTPQPRSLHLLQQGNSSFGQSRHVTDVQTFADTYAAQFEIRTKFFGYRPRILAVSRTTGTLLWGD